MSINRTVFGNSCPRILILIIYTVLITTQLYDALNKFLIKLPFIAIVTGCFNLRIFDDIFKNCF